MRKNILIQKTIFACIAILFSFAQAKAQTTLFPSTLVSDIGTGNIGAANTSRNVAVDAAGNIGVVWVGTAGLRFAKSTDRGHTFMPSVQLSTVTSGNCEVEVADNGNIYVVYSNGSQIQLFVSLNGGTSFTGPNTIGSGSTPHIASFGSNVYIVPQAGSPVYRNANNGVGAFSSVNVGSWVFADIRVDKANGDVYLIADNPTIYMYRSTNAGVSFTQLPVSASVFYSSYTITTGPLGKFIYVAGGNGNTGYRIDFTTGASTTFAAGVNAITQGRTLTSDEFGNFVDGYAATTSTMAIRVSNDKAATFGSPITIPNSVTHNVARNSATQDVVVVYQGTDGKIYLNVYDNLLKGLTTSNVNAFYCPGSTGTVSYSAIGTTFNAGNQFIVQLSDANRSFANPVTIGTLSSTASSGNINFTIPDNISSGTQYRIRVISTNIATTGADNLFDISINPTPVAQVTASGATTICQGNPVLLASSAASSYLWSNGETTSSISVNTPGNYSVTVGNGCGLFATSSPVTVNVTLQPTVTASGPTSFCTPGSVTLTSSAGTSYLWSNGATSQSITVSNSGSYTVKVTGGGCSITSQPVQVVDHDIENPATPVLPDLTGECSVTAAIPTTTDNCAGTVNGTTTDPITYSSPGTYFIHWTFADGNGNSTTATQKVIVKDITPPSITCNADMTVLATSTQGAVVNFSDPSASDNCSGVTVQQVGGLPSGSTFPIGASTVSYIATDGAGNTSNCSFTVTVSGLLPVIVSPGNQTVTAEPGKCGAVVNYNATETTGIPASVITYSIDPGSFFPVGTTKVTATATNAVGTSSCTFDVTVTDNENPVIKFPGAPVAGTPKTVSIPYLATQVSSWSPVTFTFADPLPAGAVVTGIDLSYSGRDQGWGGTGDYNHLYVSGTQIGRNQFLHYTQSYNVTYNGSVPGYVYGGNNTFQMSFTGYPGWQGIFQGGTMTIRYTLPGQPVDQSTLISVSTDPGVCGAVVTLPNPIVSDNCSVQSTTNDAPELFPVGNTLVTWTVTDIHGNTSTATQSVTVTDNEIPTITAPAAISVNNDPGKCSAVVNLGAPVTGDNCAVDNTTNNAPAAFSVGTTIVTWTVTDVHGNKSTATQSVTVTDNENPTITAPAAVSVNNDPGKCGAVVNLSAPTADDNCGVANINNNAPASLIFPVGTTIVTWTVTDVHGNKSTATQSVTVTDNENPTITAPVAISVNNDPGKCSAVVNLGTPVTADNCAVNNTTNNAPAAFPVGTTTVTWTVTDVHGNKNTAIQSVTVTDNENPTITAPAAVSVNNDPGKCSAVVNLGTPVTGDNCGVANTTNNAPAAFTVGTTIVTWTVTDIHGNSSTTAQTVTVTDNEKPVLTSPANQVFCANFGGVNTYTIPALGAVDNCGIASISYTVSGATTRSGSGTDASGTFAIGVSTVTFTVTDIHNNVNTSSFTVTINPLPVATITPSTADAFCNKLTLTGSSTLSGPFSYQWNYANGNFSNTNPISLGLLNGDGVYGLYTTDGNGCRSEFAATYNYQKQNLSSSYTIIGYKEVELGSYNTLASGSIGVMSNKGEAEFGKYSKATAPGSFVKAVKIELDKNASVSQPIYAAATPVLPTMLYNTASTKSLPKYEVKKGTTMILSGNYSNLNIQKGSVVTLTGTTFGSIHTEEGVQLTFTQPNLNIDQLNIDKGPKTGYSYVHFAPDTKVLVSKSVSIGDQVYLNPENNKVTFYVGSLQDTRKGDDDRSDDTKFSVNAKDSKITVNVMMPNGKLKVNGGDEGNDDDHDGIKTNGTTVNMTGLFIAAEVEGEGKNVIWNSFDCSAPPVATIVTSTVGSQTAFTKDDLTEATDADLKVTVMPNPSSSYFTLKLESRYNTPVNMRMMDANGRVIENRSKIGANSTLQVGADYSSGMYYAEMIQGTKRKVVQLIKTGR